jgi:hypothetical protein
MARRHLGVSLLLLLSQAPRTVMAEEGAEASAPASPSPPAPPAPESAPAVVPVATPSPTAPVALQPASASSAEALPKITDLRYRDTQASAYSLQKGQFALQSTLLGASSNELFIALGAAYGFGHGVQAGINLAYLGAGLINLSGKWTFVEKGPFAASVAFDPVLIHGDWVWLVGFKELFSGIDMLFLPVQLGTSYLPWPWLQLDFATRYSGGVVVGNFQSSRASLDADINVHQFALRPGVRVHMFGRATLNLSADLPVYTAGPGAVEGEVELVDGVAVGGRTGGTVQRSLGETYRVNVGVRSMVTRTFFIDFGFNIGPRAEALYGSLISPRLAVEGRF